MKQKLPAQPEERSKLDVLTDIVLDVRRETGYRFDVMEVFDILKHSIRKAELNDKGEDYLPILFRNELEDHVMRQRINKGEMVCVASA